MAGTGSGSVQAAPADALVLADGLLSATASIRRSGRLVGRPAELSELTGAQLDLVRLVWRQPGASVAEAAAELGVAANTVSTLVRQLSAAGLLLRRVDGSDRRVARLELTVETVARVARFRDRRVALVAAAVAELPPADRSLLEAAAPVLARLAARLPELVVSGD
jgi:DNA-binding MarR family transcriptional regulator